MATLIDYQVPPVPLPGARDEWEDLLETLHRSGTLRVLNGFFGRLGGVTEVFLNELDTDAGRDLVGSLLFLGEAATKIPAHKLTSVVDGMKAGLNEARTLLDDKKPPSTFALFGLMRDPDTRRAIGAGLVFLKQLGAHLPEQAASSSPGKPAS